MMFARDFLTSWNIPEEYSKSTSFSSRLNSSLGQCSLVVLSAAFVSKRFGAGKKRRKKAVGKHDHLFAGNFQ